MDNTNQTFDRIEELTEELKNLSIEHTTVGAKISKVAQELHRLYQLSSNSKPKQEKRARRKERKITIEECRNSVGRRVRITNPKVLEECFGTILKVGTLYVTIQLPNKSTK